MTIKEQLKGLEGADKRRKQISIGKDLIKMFKSGKSNMEIAKETGLSESSIRSVRAHYNKEAR